MNIHMNHLYAFFNVATVYPSKVQTEKKLNKFTVFF